jgi:predicted acyl esterase
LIQTPYNRLLFHLGLPLGIGLNLNSSNYIFVIVDWRCFYGSAAACVTTPDRGQDGYEVIQWITSQPWSNGLVGTWGPSALGVIQFQTAKKHPPGLVCSVPIVASPVTSYFDYYPNGVLRKEYTDQLSALNYNMTLVLANPYYNVGWQAAENNSDYPDSIAVPCLMIGGWYDHNTTSIVDFFSELRQQSPPAVRDKHRLLMGPWTHSAASGSPAIVGQLFYPQAQGWSDSLSNLFFDFYLRSINNGWNTTPYVQYFQMGENTWHSDSSWAPQSYTAKLYLHGNEVLDFNAPTQSNDNTGLVYDPHNPSPTVGGATLRTDLDQGPYNQAPLVEARIDILKFTTATLSQNIKVHGRPKVHLKVSSDKTDTDFSVRLTDVYPNNSSMLLSDGIFRMRFRNGFTTNDTSSIIPAQIYPVEIELPDVAITFLVGHKIRLDVTSSNYPRYDCNLNNGLQMYVAGDTLLATQTLYFDIANPSWLELPVADSTVNISETAEPEIISVGIYPNPASEAVYVIIRNNKLKQVELFDATGRIIFETKNPQPLTRIDLSRCRPGIYFVKAHSEKEMSMRKFAVVKR